MRLFVGLDVSLEKTAICVIDEHGKIVREAQAASEPEALLCWIREQDGSIAAVGLEAGPLSQWLYRGMTEAGLDVVLMETRQVKGALGERPLRELQCQAPPRAAQLRDLLQPRRSKDCH